MNIATLLQQLRDNDNFRTLHKLRHDGIFVWKNDKKLLNLSSNDYLNIANNRDLQQEFLTHYSKHCLFSSSSSRSLSGNFEIYEECESYIANLFATNDDTRHNKACLLFNSGYHLNISCIQALSTLPHTLFIADKLIHASMIDGLRLGNAKFKRFSHNDMQELENLLAIHANAYQQIIILTEALFSMDGDFTKLDSLIALKKKCPNVLLYIDEAHSIGAIGENGLGLVAMCNKIYEIDFLVLTFGKAIGSVGACVLCQRDYKDFFINKARGLIYSTALPPINVAFSLFIFTKLVSLNNERQKLLELSAFFRDCLHQKGLYILGESYIISLITQTNQATTQMAQKLENYGIFAPAIKSPTIPNGQARIRFSLHSGLDKHDLLKIIEIL